MTLNRCFAALSGVLALTAGAVQAQTKCDINESKPSQVATAYLLSQQLRANPSSPKRWDNYKKVVKSLTEKGDAMENPIGRNFELGKIFFMVAEDSTTPILVKRGDLGFVTNVDQMVDVAALGDSVMKIVEASNPECSTATRDWRRQRGWLRVTQAASRTLNDGKFDSAAYYAKRSMMFDPQTPYAYSILASVAQKNNDMPTAVAMTRKSADVAALDTIFSDQRRLSLYNLGILVGTQAETATGEEQKRLARESADALQSFLKEAPANDELASSARSSLARMLSVAGDTAGVTRTYAAVLANPTSYNEYDLVQAGLAASRAGRDEDAVKLFEAAATQNPYSRDALFNLSASLFNSGHYDRELPFIKRLIALDPNNPENYRIMAGAYQGLSKAEKNTKIKTALTDTLVKSFEKYQKLPTVVTFKSFIHNGTSHTIVGAVENRDTTTKTAKHYVIPFEFLDNSGNVVATQTVNVGPVAPKEKKEFTVKVEQGGIVSYRYAALK
jgi:tetratricopeptide (TPR) repeat protein